MSLRYVGGLISPSVNPLAANVTTSPNVAQYNGSFTLQQQAQALTSGQWATDPYYKNTTLLLHADGKANGSQNNTFLDSSTNNFTITRNGNTTQGSFTPYGPTWSNYFDGGTSVSLSLPSSSNLAVGTGDFCIELWACRSATGQEGLFSNAYGSGGGNTVLELQIYLDKFVFNSWSTTFLTGTTTVAIGTWYHVAVCRSGTTMSMFVNGVREATTTSANDFSNTAAFYIGKQVASSSTTMNGYISNLRVVKGSSVYTPSSTTLTVPTTPLTAITNTQLLTCQSNRFVDNSSNAFAVTVGGTPSVQRFSPFPPQYQYTPAVIGGSGYFDGSGDSLTSSITAIGTSDFTVEYYSYLTAHSGGNGEGGYFQTSSTAGGFSTTYTTGIYATRSAPGVGRVLVVAVGGTPITTTYVPPLNEWFHTAIVRQSNSVKVYVNGVLVATPVTISTNLTGTYVVLGGYYSTSYLMTGYLSGFRVVNSAVYTAAFTVPTTPPTAIASTTYLVNCTNAGITDNAMMNNLETVDNAQVSTSVVKYGSGSMYFDGTGDWLYSPTGTNFGFGTGDFTLECWVYPTAWAGTTDGFVSCERGASTVSGVQISRDGIEIGNNSTGSTAYAWSTSIPLNTWTHVAATRSNGVVRGFLNGVLSTTPGTNTTDLQTTQACAVGRRLTDYGGYYMTGYLDDVRITKGVARYTANFQPPKVAFANQ